MDITIKTVDSEEVKIVLNKTITINGSVNGIEFENCTFDEGTTITIDKYGTVKF